MQLPCATSNLNMLSRISSCQQVPSSCCNVTCSSGAVGFHVLFFLTLSKLKAAIIKKIVTERSF